MKTEYKSFSHTTSYERMDEIINTSDASFEELDSIPSRDKLTFNNGFYVNCTALFIDIRGSSQLPSLYKRPKLAKLYRVFLSEVIAAINDNILSTEINIIGDCVSSIFDTPQRPHIDWVFATAYTLEALVDVMNYKFSQHGIQEIKVGIGIDYGRALMIKAGYKGSGINDVVWMGDVVNQACKLGNLGNQTWNDRTIMVSDTVYSNLSIANQNLLTKNYQRGCYHGDVVNTAIQDWLTKNRTKNTQSSSFNIRY